ncbi:MAG: hypothetical protein R3C69_05585 [Geminicoccaceae bacterium]
MAAVAEGPDAGLDIVVDRVRLDLSAKKPASARRPRAALVISDSFWPGVGDEERTGDAAAARARGSSAIRPAPKRTVDRNSPS